MGGPGVVLWYMVDQGSSYEVAPEWYRTMSESFNFIYMFLSADGVRTLIYSSFKVRGL